MPAIQMLGILISKKTDFQKLKNSFIKQLLQCLDSRPRNRLSSPVDRPGPTTFISRAGRAKILVGLARPDILSFFLVFYEI
jgi:hypothetical protein